VSEGKCSLRRSVKDDAEFTQMSVSYVDMKVINHAQGARGRGREDEK